MIFLQFLHFDPLNYLPDTDNSSSLLLGKELSDSPLTLRRRRAHTAHLQRLLRRLNAKLLVPKEKQTKLR